MDGVIPVLVAPMLDYRGLRALMSTCRNARDSLNYVHFLPNYASGITSSKLYALFEGMGVAPSHVVNVPSKYRTRWMFEFGTRVLCVPQELDSTVARWIYVEPPASSVFCGKLLGNERAIAACATADKIIISSSNGGVNAYSVTSNACVCVTRQMATEVKSCPSRSDFFAYMDVTGCIVRFRDSCRRSGEEWSFSTTCDTFAVTESGLISFRMEYGTLYVYSTLHSSPRVSNAIHAFRSFPTWGDSGIRGAYAMPGGKVAVWHRPGFLVSLTDRGLSRVDCTNHEVVSCTRLMVLGPCLLSHNNVLNTSTGALHHREMHDCSLRGQAEAGICVGNRCIVETERYPEEHGGDIMYY